MSAGVGEANVDARRARHPVPRHVELLERLDDGLFETIDVLLHVDAEALQVGGVECSRRVVGEEHELLGVGDGAQAAIARQDRHVARAAVARQAAEGLVGRRTVVPLHV